MLSPGAAGAVGGAPARPAGTTAFAAFREAGGPDLEAHGRLRGAVRAFPGAGRPLARRLARGDAVRRFRRGRGLRARSMPRPSPTTSGCSTSPTASSARPRRRRSPPACGSGSTATSRSAPIAAARRSGRIPSASRNGVSIGAPPDLLAPKGQDWGLPAFHPLAHGERRARGLPGAGPGQHAPCRRDPHRPRLPAAAPVPDSRDGRRRRDGAYVAMPFEAMLAVLRLESHRAKCLVIAEDLGTAPEGFSDALMRAGILSYRVLAFEREQDGRFKPPGAYPRDALTAITTHDLPTFVGWWRGRRHRHCARRSGSTIPSGPRPSAASRVAERARLTEALAAEQLLPSYDAARGRAARGRRCATSPARPSMLNAVQYEDVVSELNQANMPGSTEGHPNWRRKLDRDLEAIAAPGGPLAKLAASLVGRGPRPALGRGPPRLAAAARDLPAPVPQGLHLRRRGRRSCRISPKLGISHVYASPIQKARPGSTHGYDIVDHADDQPGTRRRGGLRAASRTRCTRHGLGLILDIVPNHMGVGGADNPWWLSVLEWGGALALRAMPSTSTGSGSAPTASSSCPFLGDRYGEALEKGDAEARTSTPAKGAFSVWHYEHDLPLSPAVLSARSSTGRSRRSDELGTATPEVIAVSERLRAMGEETERRAPRGVPGGGRGAEGAARRGGRGLARARGAPSSARVAVVNGVPRACPRASARCTASSRCSPTASPIGGWRRATSTTAASSTSTALAGLRVEKSGRLPARRTRLIFRLVREGRIQGLRIDHIDGLADPAGLRSRRCRRAVGPGFYVVVEKILEPGERAAALAGRRHDRLRRPEPASTASSSIRRKRAEIDAALPRADAASTSRYELSSGPPRPRSWRSASPASSRCWPPTSSASPTPTGAPATTRSTRMRIALDRDHRALPDLSQLPAGRLDESRRGRGRRARSRTTVAAGQALERAAGPLGARLRRRRPARPDRDVTGPGRPDARACRCASAAASSSSPAR